MKDISKILLFSLCLSFISCEKNTLPEEIIKEDQLQLTNHNRWHLSGTPYRFPESFLSNNTEYGFNRAKLAWYNIDPQVFLRNTSMTPEHIRNDKEQQAHPLVREVYEEELYPNRQSVYGQPEPIPCLNLAYYPDERGPYNYDVDGVNYDGSLVNPSSRWAGIITDIPASEAFDTISFWMMSPFMANGDQSISGSIFFNIGTISKDILKDEHLNYESGLYSNEDTYKSNWGMVASSNSKSFDNDPVIRLAQDAGLDGLRSDTLREVNDEADYFKAFLNDLKPRVSLQAYEKVRKDPSSDDFHYYRDSYYDQIELSILDRYKNISNTERNSLPAEYTTEHYLVSHTSLPDSENFNYAENTILESNYEEYELKMNSSHFNIGQNYIIDIRESNVEEPIRWYHFKIPLTGSAHLNVTDELHLRMYFTGFEKPVVFRFTEFSLQ